MRCDAAAGGEEEEEEEKREGRREEGSPKEGTGTANEGPQWRPLCNVELRCLCTTGVGCRYCGDRPWRSNRQLWESPCLLLRQRQLGKGNCLAWLLSSLLSLFYLLYSSLLCAASNRMHNKYAMTRGSDRHRGRWIRDGFNNKDAGTSSKDSSH